MSEHPDKVCSSCRMTLPLLAFGPRRTNADGLEGVCRACCKEAAQQRKHGLTTLQRAEIAAECGGCAVCGRSTPGAKGWVVDHDHACCSGERSCPSCRRGVLCQWCNAALGYALDTPELLRRMADYIELGTRMEATA